MQVLQGKWTGRFPITATGFAGRSAHQRGASAAVYRGRLSLVCGPGLEKFFDRVSHDKLMSRIETRVSDRRLLKLIRVFLKAG